MVDAKEKVLMSLKFVSPIPKRLLCVFCEQLAFGPSEIGCGHLLCDQCFEEAKDGISKCPEHGTVISRSSIRRNSAAAVEIQGLIVHCPNFPNNLCEDKIPLDMLKHHLKKCAEDEESCPENCGKKIKTEQLEKHKRACSKLKLDRNLSGKSSQDFNSNDAEQHSHVMVVRLNKDERVLNMNINRLNSDTNSQPLAHEYMIQLPLIRDAMVTLEMRMDRIMLLIQDEISQVQDSIRALRINLCQRMELLEMDLDRDRKTINAINKKVEELNSELENAKKNSQTSVGRLPENTAPIAHNGSFVWKLKNYCQLKRETSNRRQDISSCPFYTEAYGYKMCLAVDLNGDGAGKGNHLSVYACIMKGRYDDILCWPFQQRITFMLMDQRASREKNHIIRALAPDPQWPEFQKPTDEKSPGRGFHKFVSHLVVEMNDTYLRNDTIYIKILVDDSIVL